MDGARKWGQSLIAAVMAGAAGVALIGGTGAPSVMASSGSPASSPTTLRELVSRAKTEMRVLSAEVQTARSRIARDQAQSAQERRQLASLVAAEYTGAPNGLLSVLASPTFNSALDTQIAMADLTQSQRQLLTRLAQAVRTEQATEASLQQAQRHEAATESRLLAEELVAQYQTAAAVLAPRVQGGPASTSSPNSSATSPTGVSPTPPPAPASTPTASGPAPTPGATPPPDSGGAGPFTVNTNLTLPSGISVHQIQEFLQSTPLAGDAGFFVQAEQSNHVSAIYLVADAVLETGWGTSALYTNKHNLFGFEAYDANPYVDGETFSSDQDCIDYVSWFVSVYYLTPSGSQVPNYGGQPGTVATGAYFNGPTPSGMNVDYASDPNWASKIARIGALLQSMPA
ncbi:MAG TPA: glucosaminidase domain-containing protein [Candidatus Dormibacteraeota bacterium]|nr:glucosaminidase domain-containing protein [Candidatus Dormibacteraeota bacterium]